MSLSVQKGNAFSGQYVLDVIATATDWTGTVSLYRTYPGTPVFSVPVTLSADGTKLLFTLPADQILNLDIGVYTLVGNIRSVGLNIDTYRVDYITVTSLTVGTSPMTLLTMTILNVDKTPVGHETQSMGNYAGGPALVKGWKGLTVTCKHDIADVTDASIIGTETVTTETNAVGYASLSVIQGKIVTVTCPAFGKSVTVDTTGLDTIDLSTYF